jgi:hypothetical protein
VQRLARELHDRVAADGSRRCLACGKNAPTAGRVAQTVRACGRTNPEGWKMVAGGRSGERGNDHRETGLDGRAPQRGARPSLHMVEPDLIERAPHDRVWHPSGVQDIFRAVTRRSPGNGGRRPPATLWQPFGLTSPECPNSSVRWGRRGPPPKKQIVWAIRPALGSDSLLSKPAKYDLPKPECSEAPLQPRQGLDSPAMRRLDG